MALVAVLRSTVPDEEPVSVPAVIAPPAVWVIGPTVRLSVWPAAPTGPMICRAVEPSDNARSPPATVNCGEVRDVVGARCQRHEPVTPAELCSVVASIPPPAASVTPPPVALKSRVATVNGDCSEIPWPPAARTRLPPPPSPTR